MGAKKSRFSVLARANQANAEPNHRVARRVFRGSLPINDWTDLQNVPGRSRTPKYTDWDYLKTGLMDIFDGRVLEPERHMKLHRLIEYTIDGNNPITTYKNLELVITNNISSIFEQSENMGGLDLLSIYDKSWKNFCFGFEGVREICCYLNLDIGRCSIHELCFEIWKDAFRDTFTEIRVTDAILDQIDQERTGSNINRDIIKDVLQSYDIYVHPFFTCFESEFLEKTADYYSTEAGKIEALPRAEYLNTMDKWITGEVARCAHYLFPTTQPKLRKIMENVLTKPFFLPRILRQIRSEQFFDEGLSDDWTRVHSLIEHDNELVEIQKALEQHFTREGLEAIERAKGAIGQDTMLYVAKLQEVVQQQSDLVKKAFNSHYEAIGALDKAAEIYVNRNAVTTNKSSEMLAKYCNQLLKKSVRTDSEIDALLDQAVLLFKYLEDKDIFLKFYTRLLSKRLIDEASVETENSFIGKLTTLCGSEYTRRMCKMMEDVQISKVLTADFHQAMSYQHFELPVFRVTVANTGSWPTMSSTSFLLPRNFGQCIDEFTRFYNEKYNGRKLTWMLSQSRGELYCNGFKSRKIFIATTAQLVVLMLYNDSLTYTAKSIGDSLQMDKTTTARTIASLIESKVLLGKMPENGEKDDGVKDISLNREYNNNKYKIDLSKISVRAVPKLEKEIAGIVAEDRKSRLQASIVRIMKTKRTLSHQLLVLKEMSLHFKPKIDLVKRCIEQLIEKEYIKRSEKQTDLYEYIA